MSINKDSKIIIAGSGVFGLSSALHLVDNGYTNITIFDRLDLYSLGYSFINGADTASADINKVFRAFYSGDEFYHRLALKARDKFVKWDEEFARMSDEEARERFNVHGRKKIMDQCGTIRFDNAEVMPQYLIDGIKEFEASGLRQTQYNLNDPEDLERAGKDGWGKQAGDLFGIRAGENPWVKHYSATLDSTSGMLSSNNACLYVNSYLKSKGVKFITGEEGRVTSVIECEGDIKGFLTSDNVTHLADLSIVACGPWSSSLVPQLAGLSEGQNGNVLLIKIPDDKTDLLEKYSAENWPMLVWRLGKGDERVRFGGFGIFPITTKEGFVKLVVRQSKYNNPTTLANGVVTSVPLTSNSTPPATSISKEIVEDMKQVIKVFLPDLAEFGIHSTGLLWYTDTINNDFIIDYVPEKNNLLVVTGGSGHGFKFLPELGQFVVDLIEGRANEATERFKWRDPKDYHDRNTIGTVLTGENAYHRQNLASVEDFTITEDDLKIPVNFG